MKKFIFFGREISVLYQYENETSSGYEYSEENIVWKSFGDKKTHPKYKGDVKYGKPNGQGTITYLVGTKYVGGWKNGEWHGQGTYYSSCGEKLVGRFKEGIPWNTTDFDKDQNLIGLHVKGMERNITPLKPTTPSPVSNPH